MTREYWRGGRGQTFWLADRAWGALVYALPADTKDFLAHDLRGTPLRYLFRRVDVGLNTVVSGPGELKLAAGPPNRCTEIRAMRWMTELTPDEAAAFEVLASTMPAKFAVDWLDKLPGIRPPY